MYEPHYIIMAMKNGELVYLSNTLPSYSWSTTGDCAWRFSTAEEAIDRYIQVTRDNDATSQVTEIEVVFVEVEYTTLSRDQIYNYKISVELERERQALLERLESIDRDILTLSTIANANNSY